MNKCVNKRWLLIGLLVLLIVPFYTFDLHRYFSLDTLKNSHDALQQAYEDEPLYIVSVYSLM